MNRRTRWAAASLLLIFLLSLQTPVCAQETEMYPEVQEMVFDPQDAAAVSDTQETETFSAPQQAGILPGGKECYNLLLIGSDRRDDTWNGNSDVMILITIHADKKSIIMTSFMRDLYAEIPGYGANKLNSAFAAGGAPLLEETLEENYQLNIDNYMIVDFDSMADIIDSIGGVQMEISDAECEVLNGYLVSMEVPEYSLSGGGDYLLNGYQAVAYMRIRYVGNSDYERTQRQRDVLSTIFDELQEMKSEDLLLLMAEIVPEIEHNIDLISLLQLTAALPGFTEYELEENRIPYDDLYYSQNENLVPDFPATIERLHELID